MLYFAFFLETDQQDHNDNKHGGGGSSHTNQTSNLDSKLAEIFAPGSGTATPAHHVSNSNNNSNNTNHNNSSSNNNNINAQHSSSLAQQLNAQLSAAVMNAAQQQQQNPIQIQQHNINAQLTSANNNNSNNNNPQQEITRSQPGSFGTEEAASSLLILKQNNHATTSVQQQLQIPLSSSGTYAVSSISTAASDSATAITPSISTITNSVVSTIPTTISNQKISLEQSLANIISKEPKNTTVVASASSLGTPVESNILTENLDIKRKSRFSVTPVTDAMAVVLMPQRNQNYSITKQVISEILTPPNTTLTNSKDSLMTSDASDNTTIDTTNSLSTELLPSLPIALKDNILSGGEGNGPRKLSRFLVTTFPVLAATSEDCNIVEVNKIKDAQSKLNTNLSQLSQSEGQSTSNKDLKDSSSQTSPMIQKFTDSDSKSSLSSSSYESASSAMNMMISSSSSSSDDVVLSGERQQQNLVFDAIGSSSDTNDEDDEKMLEVKKVLKKEQFEEVVEKVLIHCDDDGHHSDTTGTTNEVIVDSSNISPETTNSTGDSSYHTYPYISIRKYASALDLTNKDKDNKDKRDIKEIPLNQQSSPSTISCGGSGCEKIMMTPAVTATIVPTCNMPSDHKLYQQQQHPGYLISIPHSSIPSSVCHQLHPEYSGSHQSSEQSKVTITQTSSSSLPSSRRPSTNLIPNQVVSATIHATPLTMTSGVHGHAVPQRVFIRIPVKDVGTQTDFLQSSEGPIDYSLHSSTNSSTSSTSSSIRDILDSSSTLSGQGHSHHHHQSQVHHNTATSSITSAPLSLNQLSLTEQQILLQQAVHQVLVSLQQNMTLFSSQLLAGSFGSLGSERGQQTSGEHNNLGGHSLPLFLPASLSVPQQQQQHQSSNKPRPPNLMKQGRSVSIDHTSCSTSQMVDGAATVSKSTSQASRMHNPPSFTSTSAITVTTLSSPVTPPTTESHHSCATISACNSEMYQNEFLHHYHNQQQNQCQHYAQQQQQCFPHHFYQPQYSYPFPSLSHQQSQHHLQQIFMTEQQLFSQQPILTTSGTTTLGDLSTLTSSTCANAEVSVAHVAMQQLMADVTGCRSLLINSSNSNDDQVCVFCFLLSFILINYLLFFRLEKATSYHQNLNLIV